jgi:hypothetical protein
LGVLFLVALVDTAAAQRFRANWDSNGWTLLGERTVNGRGRLDRDRIQVGRYEGRFSKLTLVVQDSDLEMVDFTVTFANNTTWSPRVGHYFRENQRTRVIDLPGDTRVIRHIDLSYRNLPGGGRASVQVWGFRVVDRPPPPRVDDDRGWTLLGERTINGRGRVDRDVIPVGRYEGRFSKLRLVAMDSDFEMVNFTVRFGRGTPWSPRTAHYFREGSRSRVIDLPGDDRTIRDIELEYRNLPGGGRARVQVWGFRTTSDPRR